ncbi:D-alanyl-D-alanine carboxypeptidase family protein [Bacillus sp. FSL W8-0116]|uniref:D-alanyl-D-alanine carboxypeptidase family protein n=1 Tax=Bacillus sp. FSL W8-0116 TaxID=2978206 RepID=UPI0030F5D4DE
MKRSMVYICFSLLLLVPLWSKPVEAKLSISAKSAVLMDQNSGRILYEKDPHEIKRIASITKIMTAIVAIESGKLNDTVKVSERAVHTEGSSLYLQPGEKIKLKDLVYGLMLRSGNDAAVAIAEHVGGSVEGFVFLMNQKAKEIGMKNTHFSNPHGLDDSDDHFSTAYDMALLTKYAMQNKTYRKIAGTKVYKVPDPRGDWDRVWKNKNKLLTEKYPYSTGGKTGYTKKAKRTLVSTAQKGDFDLIAVTLDDPNDWDDHIKMFDYAFDRYDPKVVLPKGKIDEVKNSFYKGRVYTKKEVVLPLTKKEEKKVEVNYELLKPKKAWKKGRNVPSLVGRAVVYFDHRQVRSIPIYFEPVKTEKKGWIQYWKDLFAMQMGVKTNG